jgi:hypothetical protein
MKIPLVLTDLDDEFETFMRKTHSTVRQGSDQWTTMRLVWFAAAAVSADYFTVKLPMLSEEDGIANVRLFVKSLEDFIKGFRKENETSSFT